MAANASCSESNVSSFVMSPSCVVRHDVKRMQLRINALGKINLMSKNLY